MLIYVTTSLLLFGGALFATIEYYDALNKVGAHGVAIVFLIFFFMFLLGATMSVNEASPKKRPRLYLKALSFIFIGNLVFFGGLWGLRKLVLLFTFRFLPPPYDEFGEYIFVALFLLVIYLVIRFHKNIKKLFLGDDQALESSDSDW